MIKLIDQAQEQKPFIPLQDGDIILTEYLGAPDICLIFKQTSMHNHFSMVSLVNPQSFWSVVPDCITEKYKARTLSYIRTLRHGELLQVVTKEGEADEKS